MLCFIQVSNKWYLQLQTAKKKHFQELFSSELQVDIQHDNKMVWVAKLQPQVSSDTCHNQIHFYYKYLLFLIHSDN